MPYIGSIARHLAGVGLPGLYGKLGLCRFHPKGYISPTCKMWHPKLYNEGNAYIGDGVTFYEDRNGGEVRLGLGVHIHENTRIQSGDGGSLDIGSGTHIQPQCQFSAYTGRIEIGRDVEIAPNCGFYPYNHEMDPAESIRAQPVYSRSGISVGDEAWIGFGVVLLDGAKVGKGAVIAAGAVVSTEIPDYAIAGGIPARVISQRAKHKT